ncbi:anti-RNA polymerase sigma 70 factor [Rouxiella silvae]|uniref:Regulator of sigma D n=1 Tax=Rouxiella silvae TaxID=1646373 RepID=A0AA41BZ42_9GAMM|nr:sigma D regulator [Rouxiella silvae]MBF6639780.1 sigma D regulator [Rouxiella silvae]ORJ19171.1 anti-RNA polymerase sigma 70 factor [Rouxiella silvae]
MLNRLEILTQRVGGSNELIDQWLHARKELLVSYCTLVGLKPNKEKHTPLNEKALDNFCHNLVDYLSAGHFHLYHRIVEEVDGAQGAVSQAAARIYPALEANTEAIMAFHDSYTETEFEDDDVFAFNYALSDIGEALDARFELEDQLIALAFDRKIVPLPPVANDAALVRPA